MHARQSRVTICVCCIAEAQALAASAVRQAAYANEMPEDVQAQHEAEQAQDLDEVSSLAGSTHSSIVNAADVACDALRGDGHIACQDPLGCSAGPRLANAASRWTDAVATAAGRFVDFYGGLPYAQTACGQSRA